MLFTTTKILRDFKTERNLQRNSSIMSLKINKKSPFFLLSFLFLKMLFFENYAQKYLKMPLSPLRNAHTFSFEKCCSQPKQAFENTLCHPGFKTQLSVVKYEVMQIKCKFTI